MKVSILVGVSVGSSAIPISPFAFGLSDADYAYLATQSVERNAASIRNISPKEQARLHSLINNPRTAGDPIARAKNVNEALAEFVEHQLLELSHPGQLWDLPKR